MKTDNKNLEAKLELRRRLLRTTAGPLRVIDCFSGSEVIWTQLRAEFPVTEYLALDIKAKRGRIKTDSLRVLQAGGWTHNVVDLDAYGEPWRHWLEVLKRGHPCTVFMTVGKINLTPLSNESQALLGIPKGCPPTLTGRYHEISVARWLAECYNYGLAPLQALEAEGGGANAIYRPKSRYIGIQLKAFSP